MARTDAPPIMARSLAEGDGWRVQEVICCSSPADRPFEEQHGWTSVAAVLSGVFTYRSDRGRAVMAPGGLLLGTAGQCFECGHEHGAGDRCVSFHFSPAFTEEIAADLKGAKRTAFSRPNLAPVDRLLPLLSEARSIARTPDPLRAEQLALALGAAALGLDQDTELSAPSAGDEARAAKAVRIIEAHLAEPLTIAELAQGVGLTRRRFATTFRRVLGVTPYNYILSRRLEAAAEQLRSGSRGVLEIALEAGFGDLSEFTRRFRDKYGRPPGAYRRA